MALKPRMAAAHMTNLFMIVSLLFTSIVERPPIRGMPESSGALDQSEQPVKGRSGQRRHGYLGPNHIQAHAPHFRRNPKAHANDRRAEELGNDGPDQSQG